MYNTGPSLTEKPHDVMCVKSSCYHLQIKSCCTSNCYLSSSNSLNLASDMDKATGHWMLLWSAMMSLQGLCRVRADICAGPICNYSLDVSLFTTMTYQGEQVILEGDPVNDTQLYVAGSQTISPNDVIIADGFTRDVILFNGTLPGPTIEVMAGVQVGIWLFITNNSVS